MGKIKYGLATLLAIGFWMDATSATVLELPAWERNYTGTIAGKPVNVNITRFGN
ncbi:XAC2610-related protein, partial [Salmonella enterica]